MPRAFSFLWKAAISGLLFYLALRLVDFDALRERLARLDERWIVAGLAALLLQIGIAAIRWHRIAAHCGAPAKLAQAARYTLIGAFFNQALPSTVGGDASRIWLLARATANWKAATYSVLIDRAAGLIWLAVIVLVCLPWSLTLITNPIGRLTLISIGALGVAGPLVLFAVTKIGQPFFMRWRPTRHFAEIASGLLAALLTPATGTVVGVLSVAIHMLTVSFIWLAAQGIDSPLTFLQSLLLIPPIILIAAIPVSIGGWGVREGAMVTAFAYAGLPESDAFAVSVLYGATMSVIGAGGGLVWIFSRERGEPPPAA